MLLFREALREEDLVFDVDHGAFGLFAGQKIIIEDLDRAGALLGDLLIDQHIDMTVFERVSPSKIPPDLYDLFLENDEDTASRYGNDLAFLKRNHAELKE